MDGKDSLGYFVSEISICLYDFLVFYLKEVLNMKPKYLRIAEKIVSGVMIFLLGFLVGRNVEEMHHGYPSVSVIILIVFSCACIKLLIVNMSRWSLDNKGSLKDK